MASKRRGTNGPPSASRLHSHTRTLLPALALPGARRPSAQVRAVPACVGLLPTGALACCALSPGPRAGGRRNGAGLSLASEEAIFGDVPARRCWHRAHLEGRVPGPAASPCTGSVPPTGCPRLPPKESRDQWGPGGEASKVSLLSLQLSFPNLPTPEF